MHILFSLSLCSRRLNFWQIAYTIFQQLGGFPLPFSLRSVFSFPFSFLLVALTTIRLAFCKCNLICWLKLPRLSSSSHDWPKSIWNMHNFDTSYAPANRPATPSYKYIWPGLAWRFIRSQLMDHDLNGFSTTGRESPHRKPNRISLTRPNTPPLCKTRLDQGDGDERRREREGEKVERRLLMVWWRGVPFY